MFKVFAQLRGVSEAVGRLKALGDKRLKAALKRAAQLASSPVVKTVQALAPQLKQTVKHNGKKVPVYGASGALRKSIGFRVGVNRKNGQVYSIVGPRRRKSFKPIMAFIKYFKPKKSLEAQHNVMVRVHPGNYTHLVERGFTAKVWRHGKRVKVSGKYFLKAALARSGPVIEQMTIKAVTEELAK
jgi:hypothetical protein